MKTYEILITAYTTVIIEAENEEQAMEWAAEEVRTPGMDLDEMKIDQELKSDHEIKRAIQGSEYHGNNFQKAPYVAHESQ